MKPIEYLSLYLPYNIEVECQWVEHRAFLHIIEAGGDCCVKIFKVVGDDIIHDSNYYPTGDIKPYLHPLSMLTEEIEHEGETVDLFNELFCQFGGGYKSTKSFKEHFVENMKWSGYNVLTFQEIQFCLKYHLDLFNLIQEGKAIDKSKHHE